MFDMVSKHFMQWNFINQGMLPPMHFPRLPPGTSHPVSSLFHKPLDGKFQKSNDLVTPHLTDYQQWYQKQADGLFGIQSNVFPPGHPIYSRQNSVDILQNENKKLQKENLELKKQLEKSSKTK